VGVGRVGMILSWCIWVWVWVVKGWVWWNVVLFVSVPSHTALPLLAFFRALLFSSPRASAHTCTYVLCCDLSLFSHSNLASHTRVL
jgi:hypothetical protein